MTRRVPYDTVLTCPICGWETKRTTAGLAAHGMRLHKCERTYAVRAMQARVEARRDSSGEVRDCQHKVARHEHGTKPAYVLDKCRCRPCRDAANAYETNRQKNLAYGRWEPYVDADPARAHLATLAAAGMGLKTVTKRSGVSSGVLTRLVYGLGNRPPSRRIRRETADRILAVRLDVAAGAKVDSTGTRRRLQALVAIGWSQSKLATAAGMTPSNFGQLLKRAQVLRSTADTVRTLYDDLWDVTPPHAEYRDLIAYRRALNSARRQGWASPLAWDDDSIDDPAATPNLPQDERSDREQLVEDVAFLLSTGATMASLSVGLDRKPETIERALHRAGRGDLVARLKGSAVA